MIIVTWSSFTVIRKGGRHRKQLGRAKAGRQQQVKPECHSLVRVKTEM